MADKLAEEADNARSVAPRSGARSRVDPHLIQANQRREQELARLRQWQAFYLEHTSDLVLRLDATGKVRFVTSSCHELLGYHTEELVGRYWADFLALEARVAWKTQLAQTLTKPEAVLVTWRVRPRIGPWVVLTGACHALPHPQTNVLEIEALARLTPTSRETWREHFGFALAHELNQPLTGVATAARAGLRLLARPGEDLADLREALELAADRAFEAGATLRALRQLALGNDPQGEWIDVRELVEHRIKDDLSVPTDCHLEIAIPADFPRVFADRSLLSLVFNNLLRNALEALEDSPPSERFLSVQARYDHQMATVTIADTGAGMSPALAQGCFEPFLTTKLQGMGLGLALSRWIVEAHGGRLSVGPHAPRGTCFHIALPLAGESPHHEKPAPQRRPGG